MIDHDVSFVGCIFLAAACCELEICFVSCESSSRTRLVSNRSVSVTSQVETLPDVVPDQSRLIEDETTEVGAVCLSLLCCFTAIMLIAVLLCIIQLVYGIQ